MGRSVNDLRLELRLRNNVLWHFIFDTHQSVAEFCKLHGFSQNLVGSLLNLKLWPYRKDGKTLIDTAQRLCNISFYDASEMFPVALYRGAKNGQGRVFVAEIESAKFIGLGAAERLALPPMQEVDAMRGELFDATQKALSTLRKNEKKVIELRYGIDGNDECSLAEIGRIIGVSVERVRQIECAALRRLRHLSRSKKLDAAAPYPTRR